MSQLAINTTQNVTIDFTAASVGHRVSAALLDTLVLVGYGYLIIYFVMQVLGFEDWLASQDSWSQIAVRVVFFFPVIFYSLICEMTLDGQSLGKKFVGIRVVKLDGYEAGFVDYLTRWLFRCVDVLIATGIIGLITIIASKKSQRLGDMAAGTAVISIKRNTSVNQTIFMDLDADYKPTYQQVLKLSDNDVRIIKSVFERASADFDLQRIAKLREKVESVIGVQPQEASDSRLIQTVLKDYNFYTAQG